MKFKRFPENEYHLLENTYLEATKTGVDDIKQSSMNFTVPVSIPPRKGKHLAMAIIVAFLGYGGYNLWNSYLRYDSFGIVESDIVGVHTTTPGIIQNLAVTEGSIVKEGDFLAKIVSTEDSRQLDKINDEIKIVRAELEAKRNEIAKNEIARSDLILQINGQISDTASSIEELKSKLTFQKAESARYAKLNVIGAAGAQELDNVKSQIKSISSILKGKEESLKTLKDRLNRLVNDPGDELLLKPLEAKIVFLNNEKARYTDKIKEGEIFSRYSGIVSSVKRKAGELVVTEPILSLVVDNTANLVLYYDPSDKLPKIGSKIQVLVPSLGKMIEADVVAISKDVSDPPDQIKRNYLANQKLVKVYLSPQDGYESFVVGSIIKKPNPTDIVKDTFNLASFTISKSYAKDHK